MHLGSPSCKILGTVVKIEKGEIQTNGPKTNKIMMINKSLYSINNIEIIRVEKKEEENPLAFWFA